MRKWDIHKTAVVPYIIAERAAWNVLESMPDNKDKTPIELDNWVNRLVPELVAKAENLFQHSNHFRMQLLRKTYDMRYTLEMFMEHWTKGIINKSNKTQKTR